MSKARNKRHRGAAIRRRLARERWERVLEAIYSIPPEETPFGQMLLNAPERHEFMVRLA